MNLLNKLGIYIQTHDNGFMLIQEWEEFIGLTVSLTFCYGHIVFCYQLVLNSLNIFSLHIGSFGEFDVILFGKEFNL